MPIPKIIKPLLKQWYYSYWPGQAGSFPYFGTRVHFQRNSHLFRRVCREDIYESDHVRLIGSFLKPETLYFDVGANIGLLSVPLLRQCPSCTVVSFEPSPGALPCLMKTHAGSPYRSRWRVVPKAIGTEAGSSDYYCGAPENSAFDALKDTGRGGSRKVAGVPVTTLDAEWEAMGRPSLSVIKIDVEGAELGALQGGAHCIRANQPAIVVEWNLENLAAFGCAPGALLEWAGSNGYTLQTLPHGVPVCSRGQLQAQMLRVQDFLLLPLEEVQLAPI